MPTIVDNSIRFTGESRLLLTPISLLSKSTYNININIKLLAQHRQITITITVTMAFSEDDIDPYKKINVEGTPECLKTILMQWSMLEPHMQQVGGFVTDIDPAKLASMAVFDMEADVGSGSSNFLYAVPDFSSIFEQAVEDNATEDELREKRRAELTPIVIALLGPRNAALRAQVEKSLENELKLLGVPETTLTEMNLRSKVSALHIWSST